MDTGSVGQCNPDHAEVWLDPKPYKIIAGTNSLEYLGLVLEFFFSKSLEQVLVDNADLTVQTFARGSAGP